MNKCVHMWENVDAYYYYHRAVLWLPVTGNGAIAVFIVIRC